MLDKLGTVVDVTGYCQPDQKEMLGIDLPRLGNTMHVRKRESGKGGYKFISGLFLTELAGTAAKPKPGHAVNK